MVYLAVDQSLGTNHALKIILPDSVGNNAGVAERFLLHAKEAFALHHPNIVNVTESGLIDGLLPYVVMDFIAGASLKEVLATGGPIGPSEAVEYISAIGEGLAFAHARGIVHGDLKPRNILVEQNCPIDEAIKITDFGLSVIKSGKIHGSTQEQGSGILRSPLYLAPEEWSEEESDARSDIYSLGVILYQMLTGEVPFKGKSIPAIMKSHLVDPPPPIAGRFPEITAAVEKVVLHALEKDPANRPQSIERFVEEFRFAVFSESLVRETATSTDELLEEGPVDFEKTIVLTNPANIQTEVESFDSLAQANSDPDLRKPEFEMTIAHGLSNDDLAEVEEESEIGPKPLLAAMQPILLAAGVVLVIVLIGIGVYYSRTSQ